MERFFTCVAVLTAITMSVVPLGAGDAPSPCLKFSGVLGQSQLVGEEPLPFVGASGVVVDEQNRLWVGAGGELYQFVPKDGRLSLSLKLPFPQGARMMQWDGRRVFVFGGDEKVYAVSVGADGQPTVTPFCPLPAKTRSITAVPVGLDKGFAAKGKLFSLAGDEVSAFGGDGVAVGVVLKLTRPADATWHYNSIGVEPSTGDLLIGGYYPDQKIHRFGVDGAEVVKGSWPRSNGADRIMSLAGVAWAVNKGAVSLPLSIVKMDDAAKIDGPWLYYSSGLAQTKEGVFWLSTSQGVVGFDRNGKQTGTRLGGVDGVVRMAVAPDGSLIAAVESGQRLLRLMIDDDPDAPLLCDGNEPWRVGGGWSGKARGLSWDGQLFLVVDEGGKQLWRFDPWRTAWAEKPWISLSEKNTFKNPRTIASGSVLFWVVDDDSLLEASINEPAKCRRVQLPEGESVSDITHASAQGDSLLALASDKRLVVFKKAGDSFTKVWDDAKSFSDIVGIATTGNGLLLLARAGQDAVSIDVLDLASGKLLSSLSAKDIPGGMKPTALAVHRKWVFVADATGKRILRLRID